MDADPISSFVTYNHIFDLQFLFTSFSSIYPFRSQSGMVHPHSTTAQRSDIPFSAYACVWIDSEALDGRRYIDLLFSFLETISNSSWPFFFFFLLLCCCCCRLWRRCHSISAMREINHRLFSGRYVLNTY